jgi:hypothetical protein
MKNAALLFALLLVLAACSPAVATPTRTVVYATETPVPSNTDTSMPTETPTLPPEQSGQTPDVQALAGISPDAVQNIPSGGLQADLNALHFGLVHDGDTIAVVSSSDPTLCFTAINRTIYNPDAGLPNDTEVLTGQNNGLANYNVSSFAAEVRLPGANFICANAYALQGNEQGLRPGTSVLILARKTTKGAPEIVGWMLSGAQKGDGLTVESGVVKRNGDVQDWNLFPGKSIEAPIGGEKSVVLWRDINSKTEVPAVFAPYLTPTTPEQWKQLQQQMPTMDNGQPMQLGRAVGRVEDGVSRVVSMPVVPGLVRGVVEYRTYAKQPAYAAIVEFPVEGGSYFWISWLMEAYNSSPGGSVAKLIPGAYPAKCTGEATCTFETVYRAAVTGQQLPSDYQMIRIMRGLTGQVALFIFNSPVPQTDGATSNIASGQFNQNVNTNATFDLPVVWYQAK